jgi:alpha-galactosidase
MIRLVKQIFFYAIIILVASTCETQHQKNIWLAELDIKYFSEGIPGININNNQGGNPMKIGGKNFSRGIGVQAVSMIPFFLDGHAERFTAEVGVDDAANPKSTIKFYVIGDKKILFESKEMKAGDQSEKIDADLTGIKRLGLLVTVDSANIRKSYSDWADARFVMKDDYKPERIPDDGQKYILTPAISETPRINSAKVFGATPGNPFLFAIAATGNRPMQFAAENLPNGLSLDPSTGIISGKVEKKGIYFVTLKVKNEIGEALQKLKIKIGDTLALTPPIGWNGWNSWARNIDREKVISSADAMVSKGLRDHGWTYINIDDAWQGQRGGKYMALQPNEKFPGFQKMVDHIHSLGLKIGLYSTPWIISYAGYPGGSSDFENGIFPDSIKENKRKFRYIGKYRFETNDAKQMAEWGIDYLKYDWRIDVNSAERMSKALKQSGRDIVYSLSNSAPFSNAKDWQQLANLWRTGPDIRDSWTSLYYSAFSLDKWAPYGGPGHWNDADMLVIGNVSTGANMHPTRLTADEQYSHVSLFSLLSAPLLIGCPIEQLDSFTLNLLSNDEVIEIDQDPLGQSARLLANENDVEVWVKPMEDGSYAVGLFNIDGFGKTPQSFFTWGDEKARSFEFDFSKVGLNSKWKLRDVWRQKDLGIFDRNFKTEIPHHGVVLLRMFPVK